MDGGGVEFAVGGVYDGFVVVYVEREVVDFLAGRSVDVALDHGVGTWIYYLHNSLRNSIDVRNSCCVNRRL